MAKQTINIGSAANDGTGSTLRAAFDITNDNFTELYDGTGGLFHKIEGTNFTGSLLIGHSTTGTLSAAIKNTGVGLLALDALTSGDSNTAIGYNAGSSINSGSDNVLIGSQAGDALTTGSSNVAIGKNALSIEDTTGNNVAVGHEALKNQNAGSNAFNVAVGYEAGDEVTTAAKVALIGGQAGTNLTTGGNNVAIGYRALQTEDEAARAVAIGVEALQSQDSGTSNSHNMAIGFRAGHDVSTGVENTILGALAGNSGTNDLTTGSNNIIIGYNAAASAVDVSNEVTIGNSSIANVRIPADSTLKIGASGDLQLEHLSSNSFIKNTAVGDLYIENQVDDKDIIFRSDDGSGGLATYFYLDGSASQVKFEVDVKLQDNDIFRVGSSDDLKIFHSGTESFIQADGTGNLTIEQKTDDADILFKSDDGSGGTTEYFRVDGSATTVAFSQTITQIDSKYIALGNSFDFHLQHNGTNSIITNSTGNLEIRQNADDADIIFYSDDGSGGTTTYFACQGSGVETLFYKRARWSDNVKAQFGASADLEIYHDSSNSYVSQTGTGDLIIENTTDDKDVIFKSDDGSGSVATYFQLDGSDVVTLFSKATRHIDSVAASFGNSNDLKIQHNGADNFIDSYIGDLNIRNHNVDKDIIFQADDGSGGLATYFQLDGSDGFSKAHKKIRFLDNAKAAFGNIDDLEIYHDSTNSVINNTTGHLQIYNNADDGDISFISDDGSGGTTEYFRVDGGAEAIIISKNVQHADNVKAYFGNAIDLEIYHDGSNSYITDTGTGSLITQASDLFLRAGGTNNTNNAIVASNGGTVTLYHANSEKLATTSTGVEVTGTLNAVNASANGKAATFDDGTSALHVVPNLGSGGYTGLSAAGDIGLIFTIDNDNTTDSTSNGLLIAPHTQTSGGLKILENGSVGIGITSPGSKLDVSGGDIETSTASKGLILKSPNGTRYRVTVDNSGNLSTAAL